MREKMCKAIQWYNNSHHSGTTDKLINILEGKCDKTIIYDRLNKDKNRYIDQINKNMEDYSEDRVEGNIKNYKSVRHKEEPKFIKKDLENIHKSNIKRKYKFTDQMDAKVLNNFDNIRNDTDTTDH